MHYKNKIKIGNWKIEELNKFYYVGYEITMIV